jgi:hypothetical protein
MVAKPGADSHAEDEKASVLTPLRQEPARKAMQVVGHLSDKLKMLLCPGSFC